MKKLAVWLMLAVMLCAVISGGCGGSSDSSVPEQTESLNENTGGDDTGNYDPNDGENRGNSEEPTDLSTLTADYTAKNGETLTGKLNADVKISVAHGATVTLRDATINGKNWATTPWAGLTCQGDATLIIEGSNYVQRAHQDYPAIYVPQGKTLTIKGTGALTADATESYSAGIGAGHKLPCGNIVIEGGTITAIGGRVIVFIYALSGAGIGGGYRGDCGDITIKDTVTKVTAIKGEVAPYSIGPGNGATCGKVTIGGKVGPIEQKQFSYGPLSLSTINSHYTAKDRDLLTGTLDAKVKISIADGATVTIRDVTINGADDTNCKWAGINCEGDATLILRGTNNVKGFHSYSPGIHVENGKTLTIKGDGVLNASSTGWAAGIGGGSFISCGNIVIKGGTINATGGKWSAGIGGGYGASCGNITITGGKVTAEKGDWAPYSIGGGGEDGICGTVTIGVYVGPIAITPYTYEAKIIDLSTLKEAYTAQDDEILTGKLGADVNISVADGAAIILRDVNIEGKNWASTTWAGLTCQGDATLILEDSNYVQRVHENYPAIYVPENKTLTIKGSGELTADASDSSSAGIGGGKLASCGNIVIDGGTIIANGGKGNIFLGGGGAGIGGGYRSNCGNITITKNVTKVTATRGALAQHSIGAGEAGSCGTVTIGDKVGAIEDSPYTYPPDK